MTAPTHRCSDCKGLWPAAGYYHTKGRRDTYCKTCRKRRVTQNRTIEQTRQAQATYVARVGRDYINARERARKHGRLQAFLEGNSKPKA